MHQDQDNDRVGLCIHGVGVFTNDDFQGPFGRVPEGHRNRVPQGKVVANEFIAIWMRDKTDEDQKTCWPS